MPNPSVIGTSQEKSQRQVEIFDLFWSQATALCIEFVVRNDKLSPADVSFLRGHLIGFLKEARRKTRSLSKDALGAMRSMAISDALDGIPSANNVDPRPMDTLWETSVDGLYTSLNNLLTKQFQDIERYMAQYALQTSMTGVNEELKKNAVKDITSIFSTTPDKIGRQYSTETMIKTIFFTASMKMYNIGMAYYLSETNTQAVLFHPNKEEINGMKFSIDKLPQIQAKIFHPNSLAVIGPEIV